MMNFYRLMHDAYYGGGGFEGAYLLRHPRESDENYRLRRRAAYYLNYFAPIVNALVDPVFKKKPLRDWSGAASSVIDEFTEDVDGAGTAINDFMKRAALEAKLYGAVFIVVENFQEADMPGNLGDVLKSRRFPYAYTISPDRVEDYSMDKNGRLLRIRFTDISGQSSASGEHRRTVSFTENSWRVEEDGKPAGGGEHGLGRVPVIFFASQDTDAGDIHPVPELYPQARTAVAIYNHCSWLTEILRNQTFPILTFPSTQARDLTLGTNNALCFDGDVSKFQPGFIAPPSDPAQLIQSQIELLIREMYRMASLTFLSDSKEQASGIARQWEFERTNQRLSEFAARCAKVEKRMVETAALWMHLDLTYTVSYSQDFGITDTETDMKNAQALMDLGLSPEMKIEAARRVLASYAPDMPAGRYDEIMADVERQAREPSYNEPPAPTGDD